MKLLPQHYLCVFLAVYIGIILNLPIFLRNMGESPAEKMQMYASIAGIFGFTFCFLLLISMAGKQLFRILSSLVVVFSSMASYYMIFFHVVIGYGVIVSVLSNDVDLSKEQVGYQFLTWLVVAATLPLLAIWCSRFTYHFNQRDHQVRYVFTFVQTTIFIAVIGYFSVGMGKAVDKIARAEAVKQSRYAPSPSGMLAHAYLPANWLTATALFIWEKGFDEKSTEHLLNPAKQFNYVASSSMEDVYIVVVIGETTRADHLGLLGYHRNTTPKLSEETNLVAFKGVSCDTATKLSLRCMFVREGGAEDNKQRTVREHNIFSVIKDLGFSSELFAMQSEIWFYNSSRFDSYKFREILSAEYSQSGQHIDDMLLAEELEKSLQRQNKGQHLIVLHTKGSHFQYSERYTRNYAVYKPECHSIDDKCSLDKMINSFDNSILYVDAMLSNVIQHLKDKKAILIYAGDHGEMITEEKRFHATPKHIAQAEEFRVPIMFWASDRFINSSAESKQGFANLKQLAEEDTIVSHTVLFDSILGCVGFQSDNGGIKQKNNLCDAAYKTAEMDFPLGGAYPIKKSEMQLAYEK